MSEHLLIPDKEIEAIRKRKRAKSFVEHLVGPFGSAALHVLIVLALIKFTVGRAIQKQVEVEVTMMEIEESKLDELEKEIEKLDDVPLTDAIAPPDVSMEEEAAPSEDVGPSTDEGPDLNALNIMSDSSSPLVMKGLFAGRSSGGRASALSQFGGKFAEQTERAVIRALEWLKNRQNPEGWWDPPGDKVAMTGLALLTFLAHGETTSSEKYGATVEKAIRFLVSQQKENGGFVELNQHGVYEHGIATYAICEAYGLTRIPSLKPVMEKAVAAIINGQQAGGSWDYFYKKEARADLSVAGWQIQALKAAYIAGCENPNLKPAIDKAVAAVKTFQNPEHGLFGYTDNKVGPGMRPSLTGVGVLCLQLTGHGQDAEAVKGLQALKTVDCDWRNPTEWPMYAWYYITQAKFQRGGADWEAWNSKFAPEFTKNQESDGRWENPAEKGKSESGQGPVYCTTLAALTLQVYYRFLPTYKPIEVPKEEKGKDTEVSIEII